MEIILAACQALFCMTLCCSLWSLSGCHLCQALAHCLVILYLIQWSYVVLWLASFLPGLLVILRISPIMALISRQGLAHLEKSRSIRGARDILKWVSVGCGVYIKVQSRVTSGYVLRKSLVCLGLTQAI